MLGNPVSGCRWRDNSGCSDWPNCGLRWNRSHFVKGNAKITVLKCKELNWTTWWKHGCSTAWPTSCDTHLGSIKSSAVTCRDATSKKAHFIHWGLLVHLGQRDVGHDGVLREGAGPHEVKHLLPLAGEAWGLVGEEALALGNSAGCNQREKVISFHQCTMKRSNWWWLSFDLSEVQGMTLRVQLLKSQINKQNQFQFYISRMHKLVTVLPNFLAQVGLGIFAEFAFTTLRHIQWDDSVAWEKRGNVNN